MTDAAPPPTTPQPTTTDLLDAMAQLARGMSAIERSIGDLAQRQERVELHLWRSQPPPPMPPKGQSIAARITNANDELLTHDRRLDRLEALALESATVAKAAARQVGVTDPTLATLDRWIAYLRTPAGHDRVIRIVTLGASLLAALRHAL